MLFEYWAKKSPVLYPGVRRHIRIQWPNCKSACRGYVHLFAPAGVGEYVGAGAPCIPVPDNYPLLTFSLLQPRWSWSPWSIIWIASGGFSYMSMFWINHSMKRVFNDIVFQRISRHVTKVMLMVLLGEIFIYVCSCVFSSVTRSICRWTGVKNLFRSSPGRRVKRSVRILSYQDRVRDWMPKSFHDCSHLELFTSASRSDYHILLLMLSSNQLDRSSWHFYFT